MTESRTKCILCKGNAELIHNNYPGYQEPFRFSIYKCPECNTSFSLPDVDTSVLYENIYKNGDKVPGYNRYWKYLRVIKKFPKPLEYLTETSEAYWGIKEALSVYEKNKKQVKILDIGSGLGYLTYSLIKKGYDATGLDISQTAVDKAKVAFGDHYICAELSEYAQSNEGSIDVVILIEVIEHIKDPLTFISSVKRLLKPGGMAIVTTPNKSLFPEDIIWPTELPPVHCWCFSEDSMRYMAGALAMSIDFVDFTRFYKENYKVMGLKNHRNGPYSNSIFNSAGELNSQASRSKSDLKPYIQLVFSQTPVTKFLYTKIKQYLRMAFAKSKGLFMKDLVVCKDRGAILCAIMHKKGAPKSTC